MGLKPLLILSLDPRPEGQGYEEEDHAGSLPRSSERGSKQFQFRALALLIFHGPRPEGPGYEEKDHSNSHLFRYITWLFKFIAPAFRPGTKKSKNSRL